MTANYSSPPFSPFPLELNEASSSYIACPIFFNNGEDQQRGFYRNDSQMLNSQYRNDQDQVMAKELLLGSSSSSYNLDHHSRNDQSLKFSIWKKKKEEDHGDHDHETNKWMSSKMRIMEKMMNNNNTDHDHHGHVMANKFISSSSSETNNNSSNVPTDNGSPIRVCSDCNTTKTPLWRSGPRGPKSLCNACGIRQRKARRAAMAAAATNGGAVVEVSKPFAKSTNNKVVPQKEKKSNNNIDRVLLPFKKRCKLTTTPNRSNSNNKKLCFEDLTIILSKNSTYNQRVFPQDEKEAAILLMALSYGLVRG